MNYKYLLAYYINDKEILELTKKTDSKSLLFIWLANIKESTFQDFDYIKVIIDTEQFVKVVCLESYGELLLFRYLELLDMLNI